jgi:hypothetical protein
MRAVKGGMGVRTQMRAVAVRSALGFVLFAVDQFLARAPVSAAIRRDALGSSRLYNYSSALRKQ